MVFEKPELTGPVGICFVEARAQHRRGRPHGTGQH